MADRETHLYSATRELCIVGQAAGEANLEWMHEMGTVSKFTFERQWTTSTAVVAAQKLPRSTK